MDKKIYINLIALLVLIGLILIFIVFGNKPGVNLINSGEFSELIDNEDVFVLQVHTPYYGEIEGTDLVVEDWENIENYLDELPGKDEKIAVYCRSGSMSGQVSQKLADLGYEMVYDLEGGMNSWQAGGRELVEVER